jgi:hypothetical protein
MQEGILLEAKAAASTEYIYQQFFAEWHRELTKRYIE